MSIFATSLAVCLTEAEQARQPEIGAMVGTVLGGWDDAVRVLWPGGRTSWHRVGDLEPVSRAAPAGAGLA